MNKNITIYIRTCISFWDRGGSVVQRTLLIWITICQLWETKLSVYIYMKGYLKNVLFPHFTNLVTLVSLHRWPVDSRSVIFKVWRILYIVSQVKYHFFPPFCKIIISWTVSLFFQMFSQTNDLDSYLSTCLFGTVCNGMSFIEMFIRCHNDIEKWSDNFPCIQFLL